MGLELRLSRLCSDHSGRTRHILLLLHLVYDPVYQGQKDLRLLGLLLRRSFLPRELVQSGTESTVSPLGHHNVPIDA